MNTQQLQIRSLHIRYLPLALGALLLCLLVGASTTFAVDTGADPIPSGQKDMTTIPEAGCGVAGTVVPSPNEVGSNDRSGFSAVWAVAANDIWAVGNQGF